MIGKVVSTPKPVPLALVEEILAKRSGEGEFGYEQQKSLEYAKKFAKVSAKKAAELIGQFQEEFGVPYEVAVRIVDVVPRHAAQLRAIVGNAGVSEEKQKKILEVLSKVKVKHVEEPKPAQAGGEAADNAAEAGEGSGKKDSKEEGEGEGKKGAKETSEAEKGEKRASKKDEKGEEKKEKKSKKEKE